MYIKPDSTVTLYTGIELSRKLVFSSIANQRAYFAQHVAAQTVDCTMIKKTGQMKLAISGSVVKNCNYLSFTNPSFDNKVFYAKILNYDYTNNEVTTISYGIDYFQSFMFDVTFRQCYIDREHLSQADYAKSLVDPYDPSILEFQTEEGLPVGRQLEEKLLTFNKATTKTDGVVQDENCLVLSSCSGAGTFSSAENYTLIYTTPLQKDNMATEDLEWYNNFVEHMVRNGALDFPTSDTYTEYKVTCREFSNKGTADMYARGFCGQYNNYWLMNHGQELTFGNEGDPDVIFYVHDYRKITENVWGYEFLFTSTDQALANDFKRILDEYTTAHPMGLLVELTTTTVETDPAWDDCAGLVFAQSNKFNCNKAFLTEFGYTPSLGGTQTIADINGFMSRPYDIMVFESMDRAMQLLNKFTIWNTVSSVIAIYSIPRNMLASILSWRQNDYPFGGAFSPLFITKDSKGLYDNTVVNKKLLNFPYCYMRVEGPDGTLKEYRYEDFANLFTPSMYDGKVRFLTSGELQGIPVVSLIPTFYREMGTNIVDGTEDQVSIGSLNYEERVDFSNFPQVPYCTDSYLAFLGAQATNYIAGLTSTSKYGLLSKADAVEEESISLNQEYALVEYELGKERAKYAMGVFGALTGAFGRGKMINPAGTFNGQAFDATYKTKFFVGSAAKGIVGQSNSNSARIRDLEWASERLHRHGETLAHQYNEIGEDTNLMHFGMEDNSWATLDEDNEIYKRFKPAKRAFVLPNYQAGSTNGLDLYTNKAPFDFRFSHVHLRSDILQKYDAYFSAFGYTSDRFGVPRIGNFIAGSNDTTALPQFMTVGNFQVTYVKTSGLNIECPMKPVEDYFIAMFDSGVQLINGDALIEQSNS